MYSAFEADLRELADRGRLRSLRERSGIDFTSNDYLGLAEIRRVEASCGRCRGAGRAGGLGWVASVAGQSSRARGAGSRGCRLFRRRDAHCISVAAMSPISRSSRRSRRPAISSSTMNLIHASVHEGFRRGRADFVKVPHNNVDAFDAAIVRWRKAGGKGRPWLSVESLYSMDGDSPNAR